MTPRVRLYISDAAAAFDVTVGEIAGKGTDHNSARAQLTSAARRAVWQRLRNDGFTVTQIARWFAPHPSTVCVQTEPRRRVA